MLSLLAVPSCIYSFWHSVLVSHISRLSLDCSARRDVITVPANRYTYSVHVRTYAHAYCAREFRHYNIILWRAGATADAKAEDLGMQ